MTSPIAVEVCQGAAYVRYRDDAIAATMDVTPSCSVAADLNAAREVVGIEILDIGSREQTEAARRFAYGRHLAFPSDMAGFD